MKFKVDYPPSDTNSPENENNNNSKEISINQTEKDYQLLVENEVKSITKVNPFILERTGGIERYVNRSFVPTIFNSPKNASLGIKYTLDYLEKNNISTQEQLTLLNAIKLSLSDIQLLESDENANYEFVQFAYNWAGLARDEWKLSQDKIKSILDTTNETFKNESTRDDLPYLVSLYISNDNMASKQSKIERFMQNITPNLIDKNNHIYHFDSTDSNSIFLKLDTEEKKKYVDTQLLDYKKGWSKMFDETPTVKMYTHYDLPEEFKEFVISNKEIEGYFPHIAFDKNKEVLRNEMKNMLNPALREALFLDTGINLNELGPEQAYFIEYISSKKRGQIEPLKKFVNTFAENGIKTFLSCANEIGMGDKILTLGEKLPEASARILFKTYGDIIDASEEVGNILTNNLKGKVTTEMIEKAKESLLLNGKNLLDKYAEKSKTCEGSICEDIGRELEERLSLAKKSIFAFSATCKVLVENGEFSFEDFGKAKLSYDQSPIPEEMADMIIKMHYENTKQYPDKLKNEWRGTLKDGLENPDPNQLIVSASYEDEIVSAMRVIKREDGSWYGASFNVNPTIQGGRIGSELLKEVLKDLSKDKPFVADCYSKNPMLKTYLDKFGFKITKEIEDYQSTGELVYEITLFPEDKKNF